VVLAECGGFGTASAEHPNAGSRRHLAGPRRQVEVLRDLLLSWFADDADLEPRDVLVLTPDVSTFAPLVAAIFAQRGRHAEGGQAGDLARVVLRVSTRSLRPLSHRRGIGCREVLLMKRLIRGLAVAVTLLVVGQPSSTRATDCGPFYDPAECFCPGFIDPPAVYIGIIVLDWTTYDNSLLIEEVFVPPGEEAEYEVGEHLPLRDVDSHLFTDRFLVYHRDRETDLQTLMKLDADGMLVAAAPFNRLTTDPRYCTTRLHYSVVAEALLASSCYQVIRAEPTMPAALRCEGGGFCQSAGSSTNGAGYLAIVAVFLVLHARRRRPRPRCGSAQQSPATGPCGRSRHAARPTPACPY